MQILIFFFRILTILLLNKNLYHSSDYNFFSYNWYDKVKNVFTLLLLKY